MSREDIPHSYSGKKTTMKKHLDYISFKREALLKFVKLNQSPLEKTEEIELLEPLNKFKLELLKLKMIFFL